MIRKSDSGERIQGTLVLTDKRLLFVAANKEEDLELGSSGIPRRAGTLRFADVEDLKTNSQILQIISPFRLHLSNAFRVPRGSFIHRHSR